MVNDDCLGEGQEFGESIDFMFWDTRKDFMVEEVAGSY